ncbi:MAG: hypothetical protein CMO12_02475 [Thaumarchaeota archaeon]|nr:hypothetical protein [Nitrososphaerota archaeon]
MQVSAVTVTIHSFIDAGRDFTLVRPTVLVTIITNYGREIKNGSRYRRSSRQITILDGSDHYVEWNFLQTLYDASLCSSILQTPGRGSQE